MAANSGGHNAAETESRSNLNPRVLVAVCTYNEIENLPELVDRIFRSLPTGDLLIIDDQSPDQTGAWAIARAEHDSRIRVVIRDHERGLGTAIRRAFEYAVEQRYDFLLNLDGDLSHEPEVLPELLELILAHPELDVVVGSRYCAGGSVRNWTLRRRLMSRIVNRFAATVLRLPVSDCSGSLRCYRVAALAAIDPTTIHSEGYAVLEEVLLKLRARGGQMAELPIVFSDRIHGTSKLTLAETIRAATQLIRLAWDQR
ncbi:MAG: polyprenol monophosphomannose synthase [Planctomycetaceae bacterium]|nr:MAG: polyprenol monophosphomannose synthase [Planctomycetaceae bacterium]